MRNDPGGEMSADEGQRKLAAILAADAAGYSRLMAEDDRATVAAVKQAREVFRERIEAHGGRLVDTAGDSVLAEFRSDVEAVQCAVEVQEKLAEINAPVAAERRMLFRIGVNTGDVIEEADGTLYGDGVNVAARLEGLAEPGSINISARVHDDVEGKVDVGFVDIGEHEVKNIARPVRSYRVVAAGEAVPAPAKPRPRFLPWRTAAAATVVILAVVLWQTFGPQTSELEPVAEDQAVSDPILAMPSGPSIMVLPFENLSGDPEQDYFANGMTEDVITALSRFQSLRVLGSTTSFAIDGENIDSRTIGERTGARFLLQGSIRREQPVLRIGVRLIDTRSGEQVWGDQIDGDLTANGVFELTDQVTRAVAAFVADEFSGAVTMALAPDARGDAAESLESYECIMHFYQYLQLLEQSVWQSAKECLSRTVVEDPGYAQAHAALSGLLVDGYIQGFGGDESVVERAEALARRAVDLNPSSQLVRFSLAYIHFYRHERVPFLAEMERTLALNPNSAYYLGAIGWALAFAGEWERGEALIDKAVKLNPIYPHWYHYPTVIGRYRAGNYEGALTEAAKIDIPDFFWTPMVKAAALGQLQRDSEAREQIDKLLELNPDFENRAAEYVGFYVFDESVVAHLIEGLHKAGLPDPFVAPSRPVIAVLPFDNLSGDPSQEYFADGITEDIITRLAQYPDILVLGRNTTFQFKGQAVDIPAIAETLGADYVVEGSIRRGGDTVRVTAQLLRAEGAGHVWAETYDKVLDPTNLFAIQDEITRAIASTIGDLYGVISKAELQLASRHEPASLSSYECILRGHEYNRDFNPSNHLIYRGCLENVVAEEPDYGEAVAFLGGVYLMEVVFGFNPTPESSLERALEYTQRGVSIAPTSGSARVQYARALLYNNQPQRAVQEAEEALRLAPDIVDVLSGATDVFQLAGAYDRADEIFERTAKLNPNYPAWQNWHPAKSHLSRGEYAEVEKRAQLTRMDWWYWTLAFVASAQCGQGNVEQGIKSLDKALELNPNLADIYWAEVYFFNKGPDVRPMINHLSAGLEACGWEVPPDPGREAFAVQD